MNTGNLIFQQFRPIPVEDKELIGYVRPLTWTQDAIETLYRTGLMERVAVGTDYSLNAGYCSTIESQISQIALFANLGGKLNTPSDMIVGSRSWFMDASGSAYSVMYKRNFIKASSDSSKECYPISIPRIMNSFTKAGFSIYESTHGFGQRDRALRDYQKTQLTEAL